MICVWHNKEDIFRTHIHRYDLFHFVFVFIILYIILLGIRSVMWFHPTSPIAGSNYVHCPVLFSFLFFFDG